MKSDEALRAASAFGGGIGRMGSACGAWIGGAMAFGLLYGRSREAMLEGARRGNPKSGERLAALTRKLGEKFKAEYGGFPCDEIEKKIFGRSFDKWNPADRQRKEEMGGHKDQCPSVVGKACRWAAEWILDEQGRRGS